MSGKVAALYARGDSVYKSMSGVEVYDLARDARTYQGPYPVVAHPPCRGWGRLRHMAKPLPGERDLAILAVEQVRTWGGVLEHPAGSTLWKEAALPLFGSDEYGGRTVKVRQGDFGHPAPKATWLYVVRGDLSAVEWPLPRLASGRVERLSRKAREATPRAFATWLCQLARTAAGAACPPEPPHSGGGHAA